MSLPTGWIETKLREVADFVMGQAPPSGDCNFNGIGTPFVKVGEFGLERPEIKEWTTRPLKLAKQDDLLICVVGATAGKLNRGADCAIGRSVAAIRPSSATSADFLFPRMKSEVTRLRGASVGTAQGVISRELLGEVDIALPPLAEQGRIVAKLDALFARVARARAELDMVPLLVRRLKVAAAESALRPPGMQTKGAFATDWTLGPLGALVEEGPSNGWSPKSGPDAEGALTLKLTATTSGKLRLDEAAVKRIYEKPALDSSYWLRDGDLLIQRANSLEHVGAAAIFDGPDNTYIYPDLMMRLRFSDALLTRIVWYQLNSPSTRQYLRDRATGTAGNMPKISGSTIRQMPIAIPPRALWAQIVKTLDAAFARAARLESEAARARELLNRLEAAILTKAFKGELVPQDPSDEPASVLLERIKVARAEEPKSQSKRGRKAIAPRIPREKTAMTKSRQDEEVKDKPYLADMIRKSGGASTVEELFKLADLSLTDFYKQLTWEVDRGHIIDDVSQELKAA